MNISNFMNGDIKQTFPNKKIIYFFNDAKTVQIIYKSGLQVFKFNNDEFEIFFPPSPIEINKFISSHNKND